MRKHLFLLLAALLPLIALAQATDSTPRGYNVIYDCAHLFLQKGEGLNVVDYDIEWPERVDFSRALPLRSYISQKLAGISQTGLDTLEDALTETYGQPVREKFKTIPDDGLFCYATLKAQILAYKQNQWIVYSLQNKVEPGKLSAFKPHSFSTVIVYDIAREQVMEPGDMVSSHVSLSYGTQEFFNELLAPLSDDQYDNIESISVTGVWPEGGLIHFRANVVAAEQLLDYTVAMGYDACSKVLSRGARRLFTKPAQLENPSVGPLPSTWRGDTIYNKVEAMPQFKGGDQAFKEYLSHSTVTPPEQVSGPVTAYASFVVDKQGKVQQVSLLRATDPAFDRSVAAIVRSLPDYTPGMHNGRPVCVRMYLPIRFN